MFKFHDRILDLSNSFMKQAARPASEQPGAETRAQAEESASGRYEPASAETPEPAEAAAAPEAAAAAGGAPRRPRSGGRLRPRGETLRGTSPDEESKEDSNSKGSFAPLAIGGLLGSAVGAGAYLLRPNKEKQKETLLKYLLGGAAVGTLGGGGYKLLSSTDKNKKKDSKTDKK